jgi:hypothetical protein
MGLEQQWLLYEQDKNESSYSALCTIRPGDEGWVLLSISSDNSLECTFLVTHEL